MVKNPSFFFCELQAHSIVVMGKKYSLYCLECRARRGCWQQFEPFRHHPAVLRLKLRSASCVCCARMGLFAPCASLDQSLVGDKAARRSLNRKLLFPARGDWFDDWVVGHQFEPNYLHHPVSPNRRNRRRSETWLFLRGYSPVLFRSFGLCGQ